MLGGRHAQRSKPPAGARVDWSHPLARGLVAYWPFNEGSGRRAAELVNGNAAVLLNLTGTARGWSGGAGGTCGEFVAASSQYAEAPSHRAMEFGTGPYTLSAQFQTPNPVLNRNLLARDLGAGGALGYWRVRIGDGLAMRFQMDTGSVVGATPVAANSLYRVTCTRSAGGVGTIYLNGRTDGTATGLTSTATSGAPLQFSTFVGGGEYLDSKIGWVAMHNRCLSPQEARMLAADPYGFLLPPGSSRSWFLAGSSPPPPPAAAFVPAFAPGF